MAKAIRVDNHGGPDVLKLKDVDVPEPGDGEALIRHKAIGLNYIDIYHRSGLYPVPGFPFTPGLEAAGVVAKAGPGVKDVKEGDRVVYAGAPLGAYATERIMPVNRLVSIPDGIDDRTAAAMMLRGLTSWYLSRRTYAIKAGDIVLIHAVAGGVGTILCQWAKDLGATVVGTTSSEEKAVLAKSLGCDHVILHSRESLVDSVKEITNGEGAHVVYDGIGKDTFEKSLDCLRRLGTMVSFGNASGPVGPVSPLELANRGSLFLTRPRLADYTATTAELRQGASELFNVVERGAVKILVNQIYPLSEAGKAHRDLEGRKTTGSTVLLPDQGD